MQVSRASLVAQMVKNLPAMPESWVQFLSQADPLEKEMATHSSTLAWRIPWREEPGGLQFKGSQRVKQNWETNTHNAGLRWWDVRWAGGNFTGKQYSVVTWRKNGKKVQITERSLSWRITLGRRNDTCDDAKARSYAVHREWEKLALTAVINIGRSREHQAC